MRRDPIKAFLVIWQEIGSSSFEVKLYGIKTSDEWEQRILHLAHNELEGREQGNFAAELRELIEARGLEPLPHREGVPYTRANYAGAINYIIVSGRVRE